MYSFLLYYLFNSKYVIFIDTAIILIFQLSANLANRIRIKNAPNIEPNSNRIRIKIEPNSNYIRTEFELKSNRIITNTNLNSN